MVGFSPRKANQVIYLMPGYLELADQLARLGKHKIGIDFCTPSWTV